MGTQIDPNKILLGDDDEPQAGEAVAEEITLPEVTPPAAPAAEEVSLPAVSDVLGDMYKEELVVEEDTDPPEGGTALPPVIDIAQNPEDSYTQPEDALHWHINAYAPSCLTCDALVEADNPEDIEWRLSKDKMQCHFSFGKNDKCPAKWITIRFIGKVEGMVRKYKSLSQADTDPMKRIQKLAALQKDLMDCTTAQQTQVLERLGLLGNLQVKL
jgi:hypothetical protein